MDVGHGPPEVSLVPPSPVPAFRPTYAEEFFEVAFPDSSPLPWPSPGLNGSALPCPLRVNITTLQGSLHVTDYWVALLSQEDTPLQHLWSPRALGACYVALWRLPRPDLHRLADGDLSRHTRRWLGSGTGRDSALAWAFVPFLLCLVGLSLPLCRTMECLPQTLNRIRIKCGVGTHNRHLFHYRLGDDQPIKRITMMQRQCRYRDKMGDGDR